MALSTNDYHKLPKYTPFGRLAELRARPDADLIAYTIGRDVFSDYALRRYNSRAQLETFCKAGGQHHALVKTVVDGCMLVNPNVQRAR